eukprot:3773141-Prymnesium_polylepis.1
MPIPRVHAIPVQPTNPSHIVRARTRSVCPRTRCPSRPLPPCLVRMLNEPFMQMGATWYLSSSQTTC